MTVMRPELQPRYAAVRLRQQQLRAERGAAVVRAVRRAARRAQRRFPEVDAGRRAQAAVGGVRGEHALRHRGHALVLDALQPLVRVSGRPRRGVERHEVVVLGMRPVGRVAVSVDPVQDDARDLAAREEVDLHHGRARGGGTLVHEEAGALRHRPEKGRSRVFDNDDDDDNNDGDKFVVKKFDHHDGRAIGVMLPAEENLT